MEPQQGERRLIFDTPLSVQRYEWVKQYLIDNPQLKSVTDFGCGNGRMLNWIKNAPHLERINCVDSDLSLLEYQLDHNFQPNWHEMCFGRDCSSKNLDIKVFHANISIPDDRLKADCITMVEVIEHMHSDEVERATRAIFGYYQPERVIITTPNSEFNHLLQAGPRGTKFRHTDHKFEWTRQEFVHWAQQVCLAHPYTFHLDGVGHLANSEPYGPCTQIAIFTKYNCNNNNNNSNNHQQLKQLVAAPAHNPNKDLQCVDLLLDKLNVKEGVPDWRFDAGQKKVSLMIEHTIPGSSNPEPNSVLSDEPFDWGAMDLN